MSSLAPLFLVWKGPPLEASVIEAALAEKGFGGVAGEVLDGLNTAVLRVSNKAVHHHLLESNNLNIRGNLAYVTNRNPALPPLPSERVESSRTATYSFRWVSSTNMSMSPRNRPANIFKVCLTGGPCAGKTTALSTIINQFRSKGIRTYAVPEVATTLINGGLSFLNMTPEKSFEYQKILLQTQLDLEQRFVEIAAADEGRALVVCDRGAMDGKAYCSDEVWASIMTDLSCDIVQLRDQQYDAVYHMVTAAKGAEEYYGLESNAARSETLEEAREKDDKTLSVYLGHSRVRIIDNSTDFTKKVERVVKAIAEDMGVAVPTNGSYRRFLVTSPAPQELPVPTVTTDIKIHILQSSEPAIELRLVARGQSDRWSHFLQELRTVGGVPLLTEKGITYSEYEDQRKQVDQNTEMIQRSSVAFTYNDQYFQLGTFLSPERCQGLAILYVHSEGTPDLPPFIPVEREVTLDPDFSSSTMAQVDYGILDTPSFDRPNANQEVPTITMQASSPRLLAQTKSLRNMRICR